MLDLISIKIFHCTGQSLTRTKMSPATHCRVEEKRNWQTDHRISGYSRPTMRSEETGIHRR
jgi:hypothetical protein